MPSDKRNSITAKATGLIFSLFDVALARQVPFGIPQYVQRILHGLTNVLLGFTSHNKIIYKNVNKHVHEKIWNFQLE